MATATPSGCCSGDIALDDILIFTTNNNCNYNWSTDASNGTNGWSATNTEVLFTSSSNNSHTGTYTLTTTDQSICSSTDDVSVSVTDIEITSVNISPSSPSTNDDLVANITTNSCVDAITNDWRLDGTSIAPLNFSFNSEGTTGLTSKSTSPEILAITGTAPVISQGPINASTQALDPCPTGHCLDFSSAGHLEANISTISPSNGISISLWTYSRDITTPGFRRLIQLFSTNPNDGLLDSELLLRQTNGHIVEAVVWSGIDHTSTDNPEWPEDFIYESNQIEQNVWQH